MNDLAKMIKNQRIKNKLTQQELANKLYVSDKTISSWERGRTSPDINEIILLSKILGISINNLLEKTYYNQKPLELEIKIKISDLLFNNILEKTKKVCKDIKTVNQIDTYYNSKYKKFNNEWLRLRIEDAKYILTYKKKIMENNCQEYETIIDNITNLENILINIGFEEYGKIIKTRTKMMYKEKYEISFDEVEKIGTFIEIEVKKIENNSDIEINQLIKILEELNFNINDIESKRYYDYL